MEASIFLDDFNCNIYVNVDDDDSNSNNNNNINNNNNNNNNNICKTQGPSIDKSSSVKILSVLNIYMF